MKRPLAECPKPEGVYERDEEGTPVIDCSICDFAEDGGRNCSLHPIIERSCGEKPRNIAAKKP